MQQLHFDTQFWIKDYISTENMKMLPSSVNKIFDEFKRDFVPEQIADKYKLITFWQLRDKVGNKKFIEILKTL